MQKSSQLESRPNILDLLWRYKIPVEMLKEIPIERRSQEHYRYIELLEEHFRFLGVYDSDI